LKTYAILKKSIGIMKHRYWCSNWRSSMFD